MSQLFHRLGFILDRTPHGAAFNMALDEVLLGETDQPLLRVYRWERPSVSFGYFEKFEPVSIAHPDREWVRRWTGGGVVLHGDDFTYSLLVPFEAAFMRLSGAESYLAIHACVARVLSQIGVEAGVAARTDPKISQACFENATQHDVLFDGQKIAGAAQRRTKFGLLHQGSIQAVELPESFAEALAAEFAANVVRREITPRELEAAAVLAENKYASSGWMRKF